MVYRVYVEKKPGLRHEAAALLRELRDFLGISGLIGLRMIHRYDVEGLDENTFWKAAYTVLSEPQVDTVTQGLPEITGTVFAVEYLPGQFDQRADSAAQCIQLLTKGERPAVRTAKVYFLEGNISAEELERIKHYVINPVEAREAGWDEILTLQTKYDLPHSVETIQGFINLNRRELSDLLERLGLAMDLDDLVFLQEYFQREQRDPTITEVRVVDTYWSDHCRHTTFSTHIQEVAIDDKIIEEAYGRYLATRTAVYGQAEARRRPQTLMDIATLGAKFLKKRGLLKNLDQSEEINACSIHVNALVDGKNQDWLLMFKNETHNHPTEIEPFGGAATCIGGCIRDPLSGRVYVHQAMRVTGCGDPRAAVSDTLPGKLPQRKLAQTAAAGYSSYGNQIGLATGIVSEIYHPGYIAKHLEVGAVVGAAPAENVVRERPTPGDVIILLGGRTGRDGIGGATGSSKSHNKKSLETMASEVQKGNAPEERKLQRLFRNGKVTRWIKRCNDFGAGGVSVAIGELAPGLEINLDAVRKKYEGLDGTELAISESQERMAVVVAPENVAKFIAAAEAENLEAYPVAEVTENPRMIMRWQGKNIVNLSREFLDTNGAVKYTRVSVPDMSTQRHLPTIYTEQGQSNLRAVAGSLDSASRRGLAERFDSTIGAGSILMPFGGKYQRTPAQVMAALLPVLPEQHTDDCSVMSWGFNPDWMSENPYHGAMASVVISIAKLVAAGCDYQKAYLTFQEYFEKLRDDPKRWGKPFAALLGALDAQLAFETAAIGGKDSMSGSFNELDVPPTLISFAIAPAKAGDILSGEFKEANHPVYCFGGGNPENLKSAWKAFYQLAQAGKIRAAWAIENSPAEGIIQMSFGNKIGFRSDVKAAISWYTPAKGQIIAELTEELNTDEFSHAKKIGVTTAEPVITLTGNPAFASSEEYTAEESVTIEELLKINENVLEPVYPNMTPMDTQDAPVLAYKTESRPAPTIAVKKPKVLIPVFPGTNCEYDSARAVLRAGLEPKIMVMNNQSVEGVSESVTRFVRLMDESQILFIPGGFSGGDEPEGSGKFITAFLRNPAASESVMKLLKQRDGLILGICNGFQALIKLGLVPYGEIREMDADCPTLTYNIIGRHQSRIVRTRIASNRSPWLARRETGDIVHVPISHGEGRFLCNHNLLEKLAQNGQIATQYVNMQGQPAMDTDSNPNGSVWAVEGITSPDGRVFGKMGHTERTGDLLYKNVPGMYDAGLFEAAKDYFA